MVSVLIQCSLTIEICLFICACVELGGESLKAPYIYGGNFDLVKWNILTIRIFH